MVELIGIEDFATPCLTSMQVQGLPNCMPLIADPEMAKDLLANPLNFPMLIMSTLAPAHNT